jgi:hypothetical protein
MIELRHKRFFMANKMIAGTAYIKVDGKQYTLGGSLTIAINEFTREGLAGLSGTAGYKETPQVQSREGEFYTTDEFSVKELSGIVNATVTAELANGKTYILSEAWQSGDIEVDAAGGTCTIRFEGMRGRELK